MSQQLIKDRYLIQRVLVDLGHVSRTVCIDTILGREVLLTQLRGRTGRLAAVQERFQSEVRSAARLSHAHIVALYDVDTWNGLPIAIQEHAHSESLRGVIDHEGPFHPDDVGVLVEHIAAALDYADQRGIRHLALRPEAVLIDYDGQALVTDFGIGQILDSLSPPMLATVPYRAPEQLSEDGPVGHRTDVYALGVIAYEMLTGVLPLGSGTVDEYASRVSVAVPPAPSSVRPEVPPAAGAIVLRAISRDPANRYPTASAFADALVNWRDATPSRRTPAAPTPGISFDLDPTATLAAVQVDPAPEELDDAHSRWTPMLAWAAVAIGVAALLWAGYQLLSGEEPGSPTAPTRIAIQMPTATAEIEPTSTSADENVLAPTAVSVIGATLAEARDLTDVPIRVDGEESSDTAAAGLILRQSPEPGQPVSNGEIIVVLSSGAAPLELADLDVVGMTFDQAAQELTASGINVLRVDEGSENVPEGRVIRVDESTAQPGDTVPVVVSMGDRVQIPQDLLSRPVDEVVEALDGLELEVGEPVAVSELVIESAGLDMNSFEIEDGDAVGIQEEDSGFGLWIPAGSTVTPVYYDESL